MSDIYLGSPEKGKVSNLSLSFDDPIHEYYVFNFVSIWYSSIWTDILHTHAHKKTTGSSGHLPSIMNVIHMKLPDLSPHLSTVNNQKLAWPDNEDIHCAHQSNPWSHALSSFSLRRAWDS